MVRSPIRSLWGGKREKLRVSIFAIASVQQIQQQQPPSASPGLDSPQKMTRIEQAWMWREAGSLLSPCPYGKETPTLRHLPGKAAACSLDPGSREAQGRAPGEAAGWERGGQPARLRSPYRRGHHVPHQHADKEGSDHGPYPVNPVIVPVVCYQSWPKGSGRIHAGSGHAASERGTNRLRQPCRTRDWHSSSLLPGQGDARGAAAHPSRDSTLGLALLWVGSRLGPPRPPSRHMFALAV